MKKFHIIKIQLQPCMWATSKKVSHGLEEENLKKKELRCDWFIWPDIQAGV